MHAGDTGPAQGSSLAASSKAAPAPAPCAGPTEAVASQSAAPAAGSDPSGSVPAAATTPPTPAAPHSQGENASAGGVTPAPAAPTAPAAATPPPPAAPNSQGGDASAAGAVPASAAPAAAVTPPPAAPNIRGESTGTAAAAPASTAPAAAAGAAHTPVSTAVDHHPPTHNINSATTGSKQASRGRQSLGPKGVEITGSGQLPVLDTYLSDLSGRKRQPSGVTQYLAESLYKHHAPPNLPQRLQSFYVGPSARQPDLHSPQTLHPRPVSASSSLTTLPRLQGASSTYDHVKPRIWSARSTPQVTPPQSRHTQLLHGSESPPRHAAPRPAFPTNTAPGQPNGSANVSASAAALNNISSLFGTLGAPGTGSLRSTQPQPPMHTPEPRSKHAHDHQQQQGQSHSHAPPSSRNRRGSHRLRVGDPLSRSVAAAELGQQGEVVHSKPQASGAVAAVASGSPQRSSRHGMLPALQHANTQAAKPSDTRASNILSYGPPLASSLTQQPSHQQQLSPGRQIPHKPPPLQLSSTLSAVNGELVSPGATPGPFDVKQSVNFKVARFVGDVARVMGRLQTVGGVPKILDGKSIGTASPEVLARARQRQSAAAAAVARQQAMCVPLISTVKLPAVLQGAASATGKSGGPQMLHALYEREGHTKSHMRKMLDQLPQLSRLEEPLLQALADSFVPFSYAPNSLMLAQDVACNEVLVVLSGQVFVQPRESKVHYAGAPQHSQPVRLQPGTVLGIGHMLQRLPVPNEVCSDPHFECQVASLRWEDYERQLCSWAAGKVLQHFPGMQFSVEAQLRAAISQHSVHMHRDAGAALCMEGSGADHLMLLVQGQTLLAKQLQENDIVTEGQLVQHLRTTLGPTQDKIALQPNTPSRGLKKKASGRSKAFQAALLRRQAMLVSSGGTPKGETPKGSDSRAFETVVEGAEGEEGAKSGPEDSSSSPRSSTHVGVEPLNEGEKYQHTHQEAHASSSNAHNQVQQQQSDMHETLQHSDHHTSSTHTVDSPTQAPLIPPSPHRPPSKPGAPPQPPPTTPPATTTASAAQDPSQPQHPIPSLRLKLGGSSFSSVSPAPHTHPHGASISGSGSNVSGSGGGGGAGRGHSQRAHRTGSGSRSDKSDRSGHSPRPTAAAAAQHEPGVPFASPRHTPKTDGDSHQQQQQQQQQHAPHQQQRASAVRTSSSSTQPPSGSGMQHSGSGRGSVSGAPSSPRASSTPGLSIAAGASAVAPEQQPRMHARHSSDVVLGASGVVQQDVHVLHGSHPHSHDGPQGAPDEGEPSGGVGSGGGGGVSEQTDTAGPHTVVPDGSLQEREGARKEGVMQKEAANSGRGPVPEGGEGRQEGGPSRGSNGPCNNKDASKAEDAKSVGGKQQSAASRAASVKVSHGSVNEEESSEAGAAVPEGLQGVPLLNALATMMKTHHQQVEAVFSQPVFMGMEALRPNPEERTHRNTILSLQNTEVILIPRSALAAILPESAISQLDKRMRAQAHNIATMAAGSPQGPIEERWPDNADAMREFLQTKPGARPVWQAENLAGGFSSVRALAELPWQARLRLFQGLKHMVVQQSDPAFSLAIPVLEEVLRPVPGREFEFVAALKAEQEDLAAAEEGGLDVSASRKSCAHDQGDEGGHRDSGSTEEGGGTWSSQDGQGGGESGMGAWATDQGRSMRTSASVALRGIIARVTEAEAAMARVGQGKPASDEGSAASGKGTFRGPEAGAQAHSQEGVNSQHEAATHRSRVGDSSAQSGGLGWALDSGRVRVVHTPEAQTADTVGEQSMVVNAEPGGPQISGDQGEGVVNELESGVDAVHLSSHDSGDSEIEHTLLRSKSMVGARMGEGEGAGTREQARRMRSPDSALHRLRAAAEAAEIARAQQDEGAQGGGEGEGPERGWASLDGLPRHSGGWELHPDHQHNLDSQQQRRLLEGDPSQGLPASGVSVSVDGRPSARGISEAESYHYAGHSGSDRSSSPLPVIQGQSDLSQSQPVHLGMVAGLQHPARVAGTPDTDKFGSLASWDGASTGHHGMPLPHSGPCTPPTSAPAAEKDPFPAPYKPYDMDRKGSSGPQSAPAAKQGRPPLPKAGSGAALTIPPGPAPPTRRGAEAPPKAPPATTKQPAAHVPTPQRSLSQPTPQPTPHPGQPATARTPTTTRTPTATLAPPSPPPHPHSPQGQAHPQNSGGASRLSPAIARRRAIVLEPAPDQKDDQQYIIIGGSVRIQAQQLPGPEATPLASQPSSRLHTAEGELRKRRSVRHQGPPAVVLAELGMGDAFSARTAVELLSAHVAAAVAESESDAAADEESAAAQGGVSNDTAAGAGAVGSAGSHHTGAAATHRASLGRASNLSSSLHKHKHAKGKERGQLFPLPLPPGPIQVVAVVTSPSVELLAMNAALFWLVVGGAGRAMSKLDVEEVLKQVEPSWMGELWQSSKVSALDASSPRARVRTLGNDAAAATATNENKADAKTGGAEGQDRLTMQQVAKDLADFCRVEDHKQGIELLRRGEASACVYMVASGGCVLRGGFVSLVPEAAGQAVVMMDLLKVKAGDTVGELSLLANRPLWYSLVVSTPTARVVSVDLKALKNYVSQRMSPAALERMLHRVAERDLRLYATAIHTQALLIQQGKMVLEMFVPSMRMLLKQILLLGPIGASGVQGAALETMEAMAQGQHAPKKKRSSEDSKGSVYHAGGGTTHGEEEESRLVAAAKEVGPVVVENAAAANQLVEDLARPTAVTAMPAELLVVARWQRIQKQKDAYLSSITQGSHVLQHSSFQLSSLLHATQTPFGSHGYNLDWLAQEASHEGWSSRIQPRGGGTSRPDHVVHICMPTASLPGDDPYMVRPLHEPRPSHKVEHKTGPRAISGEDLERRWDVSADHAPTSVLSADEVMRLIRARVHLKSSNLSTVLARPAHVSSDEEDSTDAEGAASATVGSAAGGAHTHKHMRFWGEGDAGFWDDLRVRDHDTGAVITTEGTGHVLGLRDMDLRRMGYSGREARERVSGVGASLNGGVRVSINGGGSRAMARRASMSIARQSDFGDVASPKSADLQRRRTSFAGLGAASSRRRSIADSSKDQKGDGPKSSRHRTQARVAHRAAVRGRGRTGRVLQRRLTEWAWDDSPDALAELTARKPGWSSCESSSSSSSEFDPVIEARRLEDARLLGIQFSILGQGKRGTEHSASQSHHASAMDAPARDSRRTRRLSIALTDASEDEAHAADASTAVTAHSGTAVGADESAAVSTQEHAQRQQGPFAKAAGALPPAAEDSQLSQVSSQGSQQRHGLGSPQGRRSLRRNRSAVSFSMDSCKGPLPPHFQQAVSPTQQLQGASLEAVPESRPESREPAKQDGANGVANQERPFWSPEAVGIPEAILEALAAQPPEPEAPSILHTYSMGQAAIRAAEQMFPPEGHDKGAEPEGSEKGARSSQAPEDEHPGPAWPTLSQHSPSSVSGSSSTVSQHFQGKPHGLAPVCPGRDDSGTDLQERGFWVRDSLHDPSGITNPSMSLLMGEAVAKALPATQAGARTGTLTKAPGSTTRPLPPPSLQSEPSTSSFASSTFPAYATSGGGPSLQAEPANVNVHVRLPPPRDSLRPPKMRGLPGAYGTSSEEEGGKPKAPDPQKELLADLWREHRQVEAEVKEEERKRAIRSAFDITSPRKPRAGGDTTPPAPAPENLSGWDAEAEKRKSAAKRLEELKVLLQYAAQPGRLKVEAPKRARPPQQAPKPSPPKLAPLKDTPLSSFSPGLGPTKATTAQHNTPSRVSAAPLFANARLSGAPKLESPQQQQRAQQQQQQQQQEAGRMSAEDSGAANVGTATHAQLAALPPFSSNMLAKNRERQRAALARGARGPLPVQGRPTTPLRRTDPHSFSPHLHQQQLRQQQHYLQEEAQGWWDASGHTQSPSSGAGPHSFGMGSTQQGMQQGAATVHSSGGLGGGGLSGGYESEGPGAADGHVRGSGETSVGQRKLEIDARLLQEEDCAYVTMQVPPRTRITPDVDLSSHKRPHLQQEEQPAQPSKHTHREPHMHMRAMMKKVSGPTGKGEDSSSEQPGYVPTFLRSKRQSLAPENLSRVKIDHEQWVVPQFSSTAGFEYGLFDVNNEITYFD